MFFSVIIPIYNVEEYLRECVDSILSQSFEDYEIVLVDDGSTDKSGEICDSYSQKHPDIIKTLHKPNGGQSDARNVGAETAAGGCRKHRCSKDHRIYFLSINKSITFT